MISEKELENRIDDLCENFSSYVDFTIKSYRLDTPARHFHIKTIKRLKTQNNLNYVFDDEIFFDYLYATLVSWNMDSRAAKLCGFDEFTNTIRNSRQKITQLSKYSLRSLVQKDALTSGSFEEAAKLINDVLLGVKVSETESWLVANTKALHHILPDLIPPIDRNYTLKFFFDNTSVKKEAKSNPQFFEVFSHYLYIYDLVSDEVEGMVDINSFNSSGTKIIDNAIIGYCKQCFKKAGVNQNDS